MPRSRTVQNRESRTAVENGTTAELSLSKPSDRHSSTFREKTSSGVREPLQIADRIKELRRVRAKDLLPNPKNWRRHPKAQADALRALLADVGYADALLTRELSDGRLQLVDGHLRAQITPDSLVPVLVLDLTEEEADKVLATLDPLAAMAETDAERIKALLQTVRTDDEAVTDLLRHTAGDVFGKPSIRKKSTRPGFRRTELSNCARSGRLVSASSGGSRRIGFCVETAEKKATSSGYLRMLLIRSV